MTAEGVFPKVAGDVVYASEYSMFANSFSDLLIDEQTQTNTFESGTNQYDSRGGAVYGTDSGLSNFTNGSIIMRANQACSGIFTQYAGSVDLSGRTISYSGTWGINPGSLANATDGNDATTTDGGNTIQDAEGTTYISLDLGSLYTSGAFRISYSFKAGANTNTVHAYSPAISSFRYVRANFFGTPTLSRATIQHSTNGTDWSRIGQNTNAYGGSPTECRIKEIGLYPDATSTSYALTENNIKQVVAPGSGFFNYVVGTVSGGTMKYIY